MKRHQILLLHIATSILVLFPFPIHAHKMMYQDSIEIVVHRGANHIAPENTIQSALAALKHGAGWIEVDVRKVKIPITQIAVRSIPIAFCVRI